MKARKKFWIFKVVVLIEMFACLIIFLGTSPAWAERVAVSVPEVNMRSGPGTQYDVLWKAEKYTPLEVLERDKTGDWIFFKDFEGTKAWIHKSLVDKTNTVITKKDLCNVRKEPTTNADILFKTERGVPFKVLKKKNEWLQVQHADGDIGWIYTNLVW